jgi:hypothetical protein
MHVAKFQVTMLKYNKNSYTEIRIMFIFEKTEHVSEHEWDAEM